MSFVEKIAEKDGYRLELVRGNDASGTPFYSYVLFHAKSFERFEKAARDSGLVEMENYGIIIKRGYGKPTSEDEDDVMKEFREDYLK